MIDEAKFNTLKKKIEEFKEKRARAEGAIENIVSEWKRTYNVSTPEEIQDLITEKRKEIRENDSLIESLYEELNGLTIWSGLA